jgi:hypothetical protein
MTKVLGCNGYNDFYINNTLLSIVKLCEEEKKKKEVANMVMHRQDQSFVVFREFKKGSIYRKRLLVSKSYQTR